MRDFQNSERTVAVLTVEEALTLFTSEKIPAGTTSDKGRVLIFLYTTRNALRRCQSTSAIISTAGRIATVDSSRNRPADFRTKRTSGSW